MDNALTSGGGLVLLIVMIAVSGFVVGGLARWIMPGPDPMSIGRTILLGIAGSIIGGIVGALFHLSPSVHPFLILMLQIAGALLVLWIVKSYRNKAA